MLQRCCIASSYYIVVSSKCVLFIQTLNKLEKPWGKDWRLTASLSFLPSAVRGTVTTGHSKSCPFLTIRASGLRDYTGQADVWFTHCCDLNSGSSRLRSLFQDTKLLWFAMPPVRDWMASLWFVDKRKKKKMFGARVRWCDCTYVVWKVCHQLEILLYCL